MVLKMKDKYKALVELLNQLTGSKNMYQVFSDVINLIALSISNICPLSDKQYQDNEKMFADLMQGYQMESIAEILGTITTILDENPFQDLLGDLYMRLDMGNQSTGQFFTPYHLSYLTAELTFNESVIQKELSEKGYIVANEPTVGGGANIIAFCEALHKKGYDFQNDCVIVCQELSQMTALMCYIQLSLIGCNAVIKVGDTLANPYTNFWDEYNKNSNLWVTPMFHIHNCYSKA